MLLLSGAVGMASRERRQPRGVPAVRKEARLCDGLKRSSRAGVLRKPTVYVVSGPDYIAEMHAAAAFAQTGIYKYF